nr:hypothetical protein [Tanacetum cinerariifolium]
LDNFQKNQQDFQKKFEQKQDDFQNQIRNFMQNLYDRPPGVDKEHEATKDTELPSTKDIQPLPIQEPPQNFDMQLVKICQEKEFICIHDDVDDLIESALNSKLLLINSNSQRLDKKQQEVKNVTEQPAEHGNHSIQSLQNFRENPSIPRPPPEPPDAQTDAGEETLVVMNDKDEDVYYSFIFVIFPKMFSLLFAESEDTIFDPGISN